MKCQVYVAATKERSLLARFGREATLPDREVFGKDAIASGAAYMAVGLFTHAHDFGSASRRFYFISEILKPLSWLLLAAAMGFVVVNQIVVL